MTEDPATAPTFDPRGVAAAGKRLRRQAMLLVVASLLFGIGVIAFMEGLNATPYETTDAMGRTMGFNDQFSREHYGIIFENMSLRGTLKAMGEIDYFAFVPFRNAGWCFVTVHLIALLVLARAREEKWITRFFLAQPVLFPWGVIGIFVLPLMVLDLVWFREADRESFVDVPFVCIAAHGCWLMVSGIIAWRCHRLKKRCSRGADFPRPAPPVET